MDAPAVDAAANGVGDISPTRRRVRFDWSGTDATDWHPVFPEFAAGANAVSLLMPHAEPFVIQAVRDAVGAVSDPAVGRATDAWIAQEAAHHRIHRGFNRQWAAHSRTAALLDRFAGAVFAWLARTSGAFRLDFAASFELVAFGSARWAEQRLHRCFGDADPVAATLFLWHLAEEVEHKAVVDAVQRATGPGRRTSRRASAAAFAVLIGFTVLAGLTLFCRTRAALNPTRWIRLVGWGVTLAFEVLPLLVASTSRSFDTRSLADPPWMTMWLREYDEESDTIPLWNEAGSGGLGRHAVRSQRSSAAPLRGDGRVVQAGR